MKTKEELKALKEEVEALNKKLLELNEDELSPVVGGNIDRHTSFDHESDENIDWEQLIEQ